MKKRETLNFDMTPLIDVVFILLIFFMVTSTFKSQNTALSLELPKASASSKAVKKEDITIELSTYALAFKGKIITLKMLDKYLSQINDKEKTITLKIDKKVEYAKVIQILNILQKYNLNNLALITKKQN